MSTGAKRVGTIVDNYMLAVLYARDRQYAGSISCAYMDPWST